MNKLIVVVLCLAIALIASAKQTLMMLNGDEFEVEIITIGATEISYKKASNPTGPTYTVNRNQVFFILYENGEKEIITNAAQSSSASNTTPASQNQEMQQALVTTTQQVVTENIENEPDYFPKISFYPRVFTGFHVTGGGIEDAGTLEWNGLASNFELNVLFPKSKSTAWSVGLGLSLMYGPLVYGTDNSNNQLGDLEVMYLTVPVMLWTRMNNFTLGLGLRAEAMLTQALDGESIEDLMASTRYPLLIDGIWNCGKFDIGAQLLLNLFNAYTGEGMNWSPTIGIGMTLGYRF